MSERQEACPPHSTEIWQIDLNEDGSFHFILGIKNGETRIAQALTEAYHFDTNGLLKPEMVREIIWKSPLFEHIGTSTCATPDGFGNLCAKNWQIEGSTNPMGEIELLSDSNLKKIKLESLKMAIEDGRNTSPTPLECEEPDRGNAAAYIFCGAITLFVVGVGYIALRKSKELLPNEKEEKQEEEKRAKATRNRELEADMNK